MAPLPPMLSKESRTSRAPSLHGRYPASPLLRTHPPPSRLRPTSRGHRLYGLPCSVDFSPGRGGLLQLLGMSLSPCHRYHPAGVRTSSQPEFRRAMLPSPYGCGLGLRGLSLSGPPVRLLSLRPGNSLTIPRMALSMGFRSSVSLQSAIQATGLLALTPAGLTPAEHASLRWTHNRT
jgi:hypothetical protein